MAMTKELEVKLTADLKQLTAALAQAEREIEKLSNSFRKSFRANTKTVTSSNQQIEKSTATTADKVGNDWSRSLNGIGTAMVAAFSVSAIANFTKQAVTMAANLEGIEVAFNRIGSREVFEDLQKATAGTVSQLDLMKSAVQASNFQIPIEKLASLFEFARRRAKETGESVDYLVNSIVTGIGRKSPLILDNLGISAVRLRKELKGVGVESASVGDITEIVGRIAQEEMGKMGEEVKTSADELQRLNAEWQNLQITVGQKILSQDGGFLSSLPDFLKSLGNLVEFGSLTADAGEKYAQAFERGMRDAKKSIDDLIGAGDEYAQGRAYLKLSQDLSKAEEELKGLQGVKLNDKTRILAQEAYVAALKETIEKLPEIIKGSDAKVDANNKEAKSIESIEEALKKATAAQEKLMMLQSGLVGLNNGTITGPGNALANVTPEDLAGLQDFIDQDLSGIENLDKASQEFFAQRQLDLQNTANIAQFFGATLTDAFMLALDGGENFGEAMGNLLENLIKQLIAAAAAAAVLSVLLPSFGVTKIGGKAVDFPLLMSMIGGVPFANGGIVSGPTLGLVGEYSGARTNPEVIAPLDKLKSMMGGMMQSGTQRVIVEGRISGNDIVLSNERTMYNRKRQRGY